MRESQTLLDDLAALGGNILGNLLGARHEARAQAKERLAGLLRHFDLVTREEFEAAFAMLAKARAMQEELQERLDALEGKRRAAGDKGPSPLSSERTVKAKAKPFLPSVKKGRRRRVRK
ncbi:MAG TPA: accessory factor UbiK family protein [Alphaproteobacteria bacterium]|nr:accessory factor UbiK family protein [Alphaproteobacteria bacterium]